MSKFPTEVIDLPSKGLVYPKEHPLSSGQVEIKYSRMLVKFNKIDPKYVCESRTQKICFY